MILEAVILLLVVVPVVLIVILRRRKDLKRNAPRVLGEISGVFLLVCGLLLLFVAFYLLFHGGATSFHIGVLAVSLILVFGGFAMTKWAERRPEFEGH